MNTRARTIPPISLTGVTGGQHVAAGQADHGLGRKQDFLDTLAAKAVEQGLDPAVVLPQNAKPEAESDGGAASNAIDIPMHKLVLERWDHALASFYSTDDPAKREAQELAEKVVRDTLRELVAPEAILFVPPDEFTRVRLELTKLAEDMIKEAQGLANKHCKKLPVNEETLKRGLRRDLTGRKFRDRHNALFHYPGVQHCAPETGIAPVAAIDGKYGSIGAEHGRYRATSAVGPS